MGLENVLDSGGSLKVDPDPFQILDDVEPILFLDEEVVQQNDFPQAECRRVANSGQSERFH
jgi:hypothetical protein